MEERINQALIQIENDLRSVKSAREQVDIVVESSSQLKEKVGTFVSDVSNLSKQVEELMHSINEKGKDNLTNFKESLDALDKSCAKIISSFEEKATIASDSVKNEVNNLHGEIEKLDAARKDLASATEAINKLNKGVEKLTTELNASQKAQDKDLHTIKDQLTAVSTRLSNMESIGGAIQKSIQAQNNTLDQLSKSLNAANTALSGICPLIQTAQNSLSNQIQNDTNHVAQKLSDTINETKQVLEKKVSKLQTLVLIQLILSAIGIILLFVMNAK